MRFEKILAAAAVLSVISTPAYAGNDWPSYNRTLTSDRYATLEKIDNKNVTGLKIVCSYDTGEQLSFQTGLIQTDGYLFATTESDTFSIDPNSCKLNWRTHENIPSGDLKVNRGVAWFDHRVFRGTADGKVIAYDAKNGKRLWATTIADPTKGESVPAAPIAWNGMIFVGNAGGDNKGVKGRMYALDDKDGHILWEFFLVPKGAGDVARGPAAPDPKSDYAASWKESKGFPITGGATWTSYSLDPVTGLLYIPVGNAAPDFNKEARPGDNLFANSIVILDAKTGAYQRHFQLVKRDFHDWDVSAPPTLFLSNHGHRMMADAPKDGHLYLIDLNTGKQVYRKPVTTIANVDAPMTPKGTRFCPGAQGGAEWNGPAFDPADNFIFTGETDWCTTVQSIPVGALGASAAGKPWSGATQGFGKQDDTKMWSGWLVASNADTGERKWEFHAPYPVIGGVTPTTGRLVLFGDMGGTFYALDAASGKKLWSKDLGGAIGGGVITYDTGSGQKIAVAAGMTSPIWPTTKVNGKIVVLGL